MTDHGDIIAALRGHGALADSEADSIQFNLAADLLVAHDDSGISLDDWPWARRFVEMLAGEPVIPSLV
jgi:hypothetical protein